MKRERERERVVGVFALPSLALFEAELPLGDVKWWRIGGDLDLWCGGGERSAL